MPDVPEVYSRPAEPEPPKLVRPKGALAGPIKVALLLPLSGADAALGQALLDAAQMALFDVGDDRLMILPRDTAGTPEGAVAAVEAVLSEGAELILGPLFAASVRAVAPLARAGNVPIVAFSTDRSVAGGGVFLMGFTPDQQVERVVAYAARQGLTRFAALAPATPYGTAVVDALNRAAALHGGDVVQVERYDPEVGDVSETVRRLADYERRRAALERQRGLLAARGDDVSKTALRRLERLDTIGDLGFDAVMLPEGGNRLRAVAPLLPFYDIDTGKVRLLGTGLWDEPGLGAEPALVGGWFASTPPDSAAAFQERFRAFYGRTPPRISSLAYDAVALAAALAGDPPETRFGTDAITAPSGFAGFDGIFRFASDGVAERGLAVIEIEPTGLRVIDPAPQSFESLIN